MTSKNNVYRAARRLNKNNDYKVTDYIKNPKEDGYRGLHLIKKFPGPKGHGDYPVEIQIRTKVLHSWATAVEIIDLFTNQTLKSNNGKKEWVDFFKSVSNEFNELDKISIDSTSDSLRTSYKLTRKLGVLKRFAAYSQSLKLLDLAKEEDFDRYFLIKVDLSGKTVSIETYNPSHFKYATDKFLIEETLSALSGRYVVALVSSKSVDDLREAYPNYFADSSDFINNLRTVCAKYEYNNPTLSRRFKSKLVRFMGDLTILDK
jgi:hypothetical protein